MTAPITICDDARCTLSVADAAAFRAVGLTPEFGNLLNELIFGVTMPLEGLKLQSHKK